MTKKKNWAVEAVQKKSLCLVKFPVALSVVEVEALCSALKRLGRHLVAPLLLAPLLVVLPLPNQHLFLVHQPIVPEVAAVAAVEAVVDHQPC